MQLLTKNYKLTKFLSAAFAVLTLLPFEKVDAATATTGFALRATVVANCQVNASDMDFGKISNLTVNNDAKGELRVACTAGLPFQIGIDQGSFGATPYERKMQNQSNGTDFLSYQLYMDEGFSRTWGNTLDKDTLQDKGRGDWVGYIIFGRIPAQTTLGEGDYIDKVQVTITY